MPGFYYLALDKMGVQKSGLVQANSEADAAIKLEQDGFFPIEISRNRPKEKSWITRDIKLGGSKLSLDQQSQLAETLAILFDASVPVEEVFKLAGQSGLPKVAQKFVDSISNDISEGITIADAFDAHEGIVSKEFSAFIRIGDKSNQLPLVLRDASQYFETRSKARNKILTALIYPAILIFASIALILLLAFTLVPTLSPIFSASGASIPAAFRILEGVRVGLVSYWAPIVACFIGIGLTFLVLGQTEVGSRLISRIKFGFPLLGQISSLSQLGIDCRFLILLMRSGETLNSALLEIAGSTSYYKAKDLYQQAEHGLREGDKASIAIKDASFLPTEFETFFTLAEDTNKWPEVLESLSQILENKANVLRDRILQILTPAITVFVGIAIGFLVYAIMGAILQINELSIVG